MHAYVHAGESVQLYLSYPQSAAEPPLVLRAFEQTGEIAPGQSRTLTLQLTRRDCSVWSVDASGGGAGGWRLATGRFTLSVRASSRDMRLSHEFDLTQR